MRRKIGIFVLLLAQSLVLPAPVAMAASAPVLAVDRVVAVVNEDVITAHELAQQIRSVQQQLSQQGTAQPPQDVLQRQVLERMINERVLLQLAKQIGVRVDDAQLNQALQRIAAQNKLDAAGFRAALEKDGVNFARFREQIRNEIMIARLREREVDARVAVSDGEVNSFLQTYGGQAQDEYVLGHVLVQIPEQASPEQIAAARSKALKAQQELQQGKEFKQVAAAYSDAPDALQGGVLQRKSGQLPGLFLDAVQKLPVGGVSEVLRSPNGFHVLTVINKTGQNEAMVVEQTHARHILIKPTEVLSDEEARAKLVQLRERIANGSKFSELARLNSEDGSASKGGDLGWISPGDTVPEFERALNALKPGELSPPVRSPFGWHLIEVLERRQQDVTADRRKMQARMAIRERKADEAFQEFVRQQRDQAYIEYRLDEQ